MIFKSKYHEELYNSYMNEFKHEDSYVKGFSFVLSALEKDLLKEVSELNLDAIKEKSEVYSESERLLVDLAFNCFFPSVYPAVNLRAISKSFDEDNKGVLVEYLRIIL